MVLVFDLVLSTRRKALTGIERFALALYETAKRVYPETYAVVRDASFLSTRDRVIEVESASRGWLSLTRHLKSLSDQDVVVICPAFPASPSLVLSRYRVLRIIHDSFAWTKPQYMTRKGLLMFRYFEQLMMWRNDLVVTPSETCRPALERILGRSVGFCGNAVGLRSGSSAAVAPEGFPFAAGDFILLVGTVEPRKNYDRLIEAAPAFARASVPLVIVGKPGWGDVASRLRDRCDDSMIWLTDCSDEEVAWLYGHCGAFLTLSHAEGFNMPLVEAGVFGSPVICSDLDIHRHVAPPWAVFVDDGVTGDQLAEIGRASSRSRDGSTAAEYRAKYSWGNVLSNVVASIEALPGRRGASLGRTSTDA